MTPREIVQELDRHIIGQAAAKRAVAIALRNRWRRMQLDPALRNVIVGIQATDRELQSVLERHGVTRIESLGKPFNAEFHQAMMEVENADVPSGTVVQELIPGYLIAGRLLRAAMVAVSKGGPAASPNASNEN